MIVVRDYHRRPFARTGTPSKEINRTSAPVSCMINLSQPSNSLSRRRLMKPTVILAKHLELLLMISLLVSAGCASPSKQQPTTVGPHCSIEWDRANDPKVTGYQLTVIDRSEQTKQVVQFIPADTTKVSCMEAGANHEGQWDVTVQSCYDKSTCGPSTEAARMHITAK
jgi:hypothetical protein